LDFEIRRQTELYNSGEKIVQETRLWDEKLQQTLPMRTKEEAKDYRYFPDPDLPPFIIRPEKVKAVKESIPELPQAKQLRFMQEYGLSEYDARILVFSKKDADFAQGCIELYAGKHKKTIVNWLIGPLMSEANARNCGLADLRISGQALNELVAFVDSEQVSNLAAKSVLSEMIEGGLSAAEIIKAKNLIQISDTGALETQVEEVLKENPKSVESYQQGKANALMFLVGQVMKKTGGKANPKVVQEILKRRLS
jgi:aspartyl-tRNA(Asn)/glutamyl-tRNA(Gln) amidotransferase subunit B